MTLVVGAFFPSHRDQLVPRDAARYGPIQIPRWEDCARTFYVEREPVACVGIVPYYAGVGKAWAWVDQKAEPHLREISRLLKRQVLPDAERLLGFWRIETDVPADDERGLRWAHWLGFRDEVVMPGYSPRGEPHMLLSRLRGSPWH